MIAIVLIVTVNQKHFINHKNKTMKRIFTLIICCFVVTSLFGQSGKPVARARGEFINNRNKLIGKEINEQEPVRRKMITSSRLNNLHVKQLKSAMVPEQLLDSVIAEGYDETYIYGLLEKEEYVYNSKGNRTTYLFFTWDKTTSKWVESEKYESTYDANGNEVQLILSNWEVNTGEWVATEKYEGTFDANGNLVLDYYSEWNESTGNWVLEWKYETIFDAGGNVIQSFDYVWDNDVNNWVSSVKDDYSYDANGNLIQYISYDWDSNNNSWLGYEKIDYAYNPSENMNTETKYEWSQDAWVSTTKYESYYDSEGNETREVSYNWDDVAKQWILYRMDEYIYNSFGAWSQYISYDWDIYNEKWLVAYESNYYYSLHDVTNVAVLKDELTVYPNPVMDGFRVSGLNEMSNLTLFDMNGKELLSKEINNNEYVSVSSLPKGIYFIRLIYSNAIVERKLVKR